MCVITLGDKENAENIVQHDDFVDSLKKFLEGDILKAMVSILHNCSPCYILQHFKHECKMLDNIRVELDGARAKAKKTTSEEKKQAVSVKYTGDFYMHI